VKKGTAVLGKGKTDANGKFTVKINKVQSADSLLHVTGSDAEGTAKTSLKIIVKKGTPPSAPKVNVVSNNSTVVTGKATAGLQVKIKNKSKNVIASGTANNKGDFKIEIKKQKAGTELYVTSTDLAKRESKATKIVVIDKIPPKAPKVNAVTNNDTVIKGKTEAYATVTVTHKDKKLGSKKANSKGEFKVDIKKQKADTILQVTAKDKAGNTSKATKTVVKDKIPPKAPKVNAVTNNDTVIKGKTEAYATVTVTHKGKKLGSKKANSKGEFKVAIKKQKAGSTLSISAKDKAGNKSKITRVTVKKYKKK
jgi:cell wall-associated protease